MEGSPEASRKRGRKKGRRGSEDGSGSESGYSDDNRQEGSQRRRLDRAQDGTPVSRRSEVMKRACSLNTRFAEG